ncbi:MAG: GTP-binding protein [Pedosphaera sp.]|nr:GTP-binding protein [Pedosphaera sp.]
MDTDLRPNLLTGGSTKLLLKTETQQIIGCAFDVLNEIGHGLHEKIYENALVVEFKLRDILFEQQKRYPVHYKNVQIGEFIPDLVAFNAVICDMKVIDQITDHERGKMTNYLRISKLRVGLILNFKNARLEWDRLVL